MNPSEKAAQFKSLHVKGDPLVLYNIWDAGGAKTLVDAGTPAVATGSWSLAAAHGFADGETIPLEFVLQIVERIAVSTNLPLTVDFEGGYATDPEGVAGNVAKIIDAGAIGINLEDQIVQGDGLYTIADQAARIKAVRGMADASGVALFINARTDLFLGSDQITHKTLVDEAVQRAAAYAEAGADGFFVPGLTNLSLIEYIVGATSVPVNVMMMGKFGSIQDVANVGVARVSYGPAPYLSAQADLSARYDVLKS